MATATFTITPDPSQNTNYSLNSQLARNLKIEVGELEFDGGTYSTGGISFTPRIGATNLVAVILLPAEADAGGYVWAYDYTNNKIQVYESGTASAALDELDNASDTLSGTVKYIAIGY